MLTLKAEEQQSRKPKTKETASFRVLGSRVDRVTFDDAVQIVHGLAVADRPHHIVTANTLMLLAAENDKELHHIIESASLVVPESWGVRWASRRIGDEIDHYVPGIDLMISLCAEAAHDLQRVYLLGSKPGVADIAAQALTRRFPGLQIVGTRDGYFRADDEAPVLESIKQARPHYLFVGLSVPAQEKWIACHLADLNVPVIMGVGGSFDVLSGRLNRAPLWMRRAGIEWIYRTLQEPWRLRRIRNLPVFMWRVFRRHT